MFNKLFLFVGNGAEVEKLKHIDLLLLLISNNHLYRPNYLKKKPSRKQHFASTYAVLVLTVGLISTNVILEKRVWRFSDGVMPSKKTFQEDKIMC